MSDNQRNTTKNDSDSDAAETADQDLKTVDVEGSAEEDGAASEAGSDSAEAGEKAVTEPKPSVTEGPPAVKATMSSRKAHLTVSRVEPWSVMKFSFVISLVCFIILFVAVAVIYTILSVLGVFDELTSMINARARPQPGRMVLARPGPGLHRRDRCPEHRAAHGLGHGRFDVVQPGRRPGRRCRRHTLRSRMRHSGSAHRSGRPHTCPEHSGTGVK